MNKVQLKFLSVIKEHAHRLPFMIIQFVADVVGKIMIELVEFIIVLRSKRMEGCSDIFHTKLQGAIEIG